MKINEKKLNELKDLSDGTTELMKDLLVKFYENSIKLLDTADESAKVEDYKKVEYVVHTLKGSALSLGLEPMGEFVTSFNATLKEGIYDNVAGNLAKLRENVIESKALMDTL